MLPPPRSSNKNVIFSPMRQTVSPDDVVIPTSGQANRSPPPKHYNDILSPTDAQAEVKALEQYQQRVKQINGQLDETLLYLSNLYQPVESPLIMYVQIQKQNDYKKVIANSKKAVTNLRQEIKGVKFGVKSLRDPTNLRFLTSQRAHYEMSDKLSEQVKMVQYKAENVSLLCDVHLEIEKEEQNFRELYQSDRPVCQVKVMDEAERLYSHTEKISTDSIKKAVDHCCSRFNQITIEYIQMKKRLENMLGNNEVRTALGNLLKHFLNKIDAQIGKCMMWNERIYKLRYLGSPVESELDSLNIESLQTEYNNFMAEVGRDYTKIDAFLRYQEGREALQSQCRKKNERLKSYVSKQLHEKTAERIKKFSTLLALMDENLSLLDECTTAAAKVKNTVDYLVQTGDTDLEQGGMKGHLKDERDHLNQVAKLGQSLQMKNAKEYEVMKKVTEWYIPQFLAMGEIYDLILKYFYKEASSALFKEKGKEQNHNFQIFSNNYNALVKNIQEEYLKTQLNKCLRMWQATA